VARIHLSKQKYTNQLKPMDNQIAIYCLGPVGTNAHQVAEGYAAELPARAAPPPKILLVGSNRHALQKLDGSEIGDAFAVVPVENSSGNMVDDTVAYWLGRLSESSGAHPQVLAERIVRVNHCLAAPAGARRVLAVLSHEQALRQCSNLIHCRAYGAQAVESTARAAEMVANGEGPRDAAAICSPETAAAYGLAVLEEGVADQPDNQTRFHIVGYAGSQPAQTGSDRTAMLFELENRPNALASVLLFFGAHGVNLSSLHSRGIGSGRYAFYLEADCHRNDERGRKALACLETLVPRGRMLVLGSYPQSPKKP
jgi:prephenate dehydratase